MMLSERHKIQKGIIQKQHEIDSIRDRIADLEFAYSVEQTDDLDARRKAYDKLRHTRVELRDLKLQLNIENET